MKTKTKPNRSHFDVNDLASDIKGRSVRGGAATILGQGVRFVVHTLSTVVLARLLVPADFGLITMVAAVTVFVSLFGDIGLSMATVQREKINHEQVSTLFWINAGLGALTTTVTLVLAPGIAWFYSEQRLTMITVVLAFNFLLGGLAVQHRALLQRRMRFVALASIHIVSEITGVGIAIVSAKMGAGYWALVIMQTATAMVDAIGVWLASGWKPGRPDWHSGVRSMLVFGGNITGFNIVNYFARNADNVLIGRTWVAGPLGLYNKAYALLMLPLYQINIPLSSVAIPTLSRLYSDHLKYKEYYLKTISLITFVSIPLVVFFIVCSHALILLILGSKWVAAGEIFSVLGFSALVQPLYFTQGWLHVSSGRSDRYVRWGIANSVFVVLGFVVGLPYGPFGVAMSYAIVSWITIVPCMWYAGGSAGIGVSEIFAAVGRNIAAGLGSIGVSFMLLEHVIIPKTTWAQLFVGLSSVVITYCLFLLVLYRDLSLWRSLISVAVAFKQPIARKSPQKVEIV